MTETPEPAHDGAALLDEMAHWTGVVGRIQQVLMEHGGAAALKMGDDVAAAMADAPAPAEPADLWSQGLAIWRAMLPESGAQAATGDRRFASPRWQEPLFDLIRQSYAAATEQVLGMVEAAEGLDERQKQQLRFATRALLEAASPTNFAMTNPEVVARIVETRGANLVTGIERMLGDMARRQIRHVGEDAFELGRNIATAPGKVIHETPLYQLIHYAPTTDEVQKTPLIIFPPWINRFYILDLSPEKSFVRWAVDQGLSVFMVSWKSADASMAEVTMEDYVLRGQLDAIETVTTLLDVPSAHVIGYCVAGTALAMLLAWAAANDKADRIASATFFTAQVDFSAAGDLSLFVDDAQLSMIDGLVTEGYLDGRYMAAVFNLLRGRDLIWNYVVNNYLLAEDYPPFDLLHWNGDVTNLPAGWHRRYLTDLYRDNLLVKPGALSLAGTPLDLSRIETPAYVQAGREDHIAPLASVWKLMRHLRGDKTFLLAGSGHIAGVVNPPAAKKYQYWTNPEPVDSLEDFIAGATETPGSWWPHWIDWIRARDAVEVPATGKRVPGGKGDRVIEDAPGRYVKSR